MHHIPTPPPAWRIQQHQQQSSDQFQPRHQAFSASSHPPAPSPRFCHIIKIDRDPMPTPSTPNDICPVCPPKLARSMDSAAQWVTAARNVVSRSVFRMAPSRRRQQMVELSIMAARNNEAPMKLEAMLWIVVLILVALAFLFPKTRALSLSAIGFAIIAIVSIIVIAKHQEPLPLQA